ncbi:MAG: 7-cyano-7-deazaguanine synthase QueC [Desulfobacteraceae bacterium]|nr:7-cyano-7-deazaguanine synthase QueC [Desulfobacteraceae bacterium]
MKNSAKDTPKAVVLLSGGLDSATTLAAAIKDGYICHTLSFDYGQRHHHELAAGQRISVALGAADHKVIRLDLRSIGGSALTADIDVPKQSNQHETGSEIPATYVPARNTIFLSIALAHAEVLGATDIFIGVNAVDYSGYPDCRPEYIEAFEQMANLATKTAVQGKQKIHIRTPLIELPKSEIIKKGTALGVDFSITTSCYDPSPEGLACGLCDSCVIRRKGFLQAGIPDPTIYVKKNE